MTYSVVITIDNRLMADLTDPSPHLVHGVLDGDAWPTIKKSETSSEIRVNSLNSHNGVQGSVTYTSAVLGQSRKATFFFVCNKNKHSASTTADAFSSLVSSQSVDPPLIVTYTVQELVD